MMFVKKITLLSVLLLLVGCSSNQQYYWDEYEAVIYQYHQNDVVGYDSQASNMEKILEKARSKNKPVPPGFHAHLGLLYANLGQVDKAIAQFDIEKTLFVESVTFMDFLINQTKGKAR